jgi:hypothetical protein
MSEPWLRILNYKTEFGFERGPTIPFILGALRQPIGFPATRDESKKQLRDLLVDMRDGLQGPACVVIRRCGGIDALVVELLDSEPKGPRRIASPLDPTRALYHEATLGVHDIESLTAALWTLHRDPLSTGRFSRDRDSQDWREFRDWERERIRKALEA